jgi:aminoglycoside phosphotransferase (APT) family kinase protein
MAAACQLIGRTRFRTPEPVAIGEPGPAYPLPWSVQTWLPGAVATEQDPSESIAFAYDLAEFVDGVRGIDTEGARFDGTNRGGDLRSRDAWMEECFQGNERLLDVEWLRKTWQAFRTLPRTAPDVMTHGDLIPGNLVVADGKLTGVLDVGDMAPADPALDLVGAWHVYMNDLARHIIGTRRPREGASNSSGLIPKNAYGVSAWRSSASGSSSYSSRTWPSVLRTS